MISSQLRLSSGGIHESLYERSSQLSQSFRVHVHDRCFQVQTFAITKFFRQNFYFILLDITEQHILYLLY